MQTSETTGESAGARAAQRRLSRAEQRVASDTYAKASMKGRLTAPFGLYDEHVGNGWATSSSGIGHCAAHTGRRWREYTAAGMNLNVGESQPLLPRF